MRFRYSGNQLFVASPAKINLFLELLGKREDGFHEIETVMTTVSLFDDLCFEAMTTTLTLSVEKVHRGKQPEERDVIPTDGRNLIIRALELLKAEANAPELGMRVKLWKRIPSAAGLGGASSNAAAALLAGNALWGLGLDTQKLCSLAGNLGSDIPFFIEGGIAECRGRGEIISQVSPAISGLAIVIIKPNVSLSTPDVFAEVTLPKQPKPMAPMTKALIGGDRNRIARRLANRLSEAAGRLTDEIQDIERCFCGLGALGHQLSGSGSSYFGLFANAKLAGRADSILRSRFPHARVFRVNSLSGRSDLEAVHCLKLSH